MAARQAAKGDAVALTIDYLALLYANVMVESVQIQLERTFKIMTVMKIRLP